MSLETATYIHQLNPVNPLGSDPIASGDDHIRLVKSALQATFPNIEGPVTVTQDDLNSIEGLAADIEAALAGINGRVRQMVMSQNGSYANTSSTAHVATGHTAVITPTSASSKILVMVSSMLWQTNVYGNSCNAYMTIYRTGTGGSTNLAGSTNSFTMMNANVNGASGASAFGATSYQYLDSPNTTSAITYQPYIKADGGGNAGYNGSGNGTIVLLEIL